MRNYLTTLICFCIIALILNSGCQPVEEVKKTTQVPIIETSAEEAAAEPADEKTARKVVEEPLIPREPEPPEKLRLPDPVSVTVNGVNIRLSQVDERVQVQMDRVIAQSGGGVPEDLISHYKQKMKPHVLNTMISETLLDEKVKEKNIVITKRQIAKKIKDIAASQDPPLTLDDLKALIEAYGQTFDEWKQNMQFEKGLAYQQIIDEQLAGKVNITEEDAREFYSENSQRFQRPEQVKASHILIKPDTAEPNADPNQAKAAAKAKAEELLKQIKQQGADFATLAKKNSQCPSSANGGDLNFFARGQMVPEFEKTAFELKIGQVSDIVETKFGYHIIRLTDRKNAETVEFEQTRDQLIDRLTRQRRNQLIQEYIQSLREQADIVYPRGQKPMASPRPFAMPTYVK